MKLLQSPEMAFKKYRDEVNIPARTLCKLASSASQEPITANTTKIIAVMIASMEIGGDEKDLYKYFRKALSGPVYIQMRLIKRIKKNLSKFNLWPYRCRYLTFINHCIALDDEEDMLDMQLVIDSLVAVGDVRLTEVLKESDLKYPQMSNEPVFMDEDPLYEMYPELKNNLEKL